MTNERMRVTFTRGSRNSSNSESSCQTSWRLRYSKFRALGMLARLYTSRDCNTLSARFLQSEYHFSKFQTLPSSDIPTLLVP